MSKRTLKGPMIRYDMQSRNNFIIPKDCVIHIPEEISVVWNYNFGDPKAFIGFANLISTDDGFDITVETTREDLLQLISTLDNRRILCGGWYHRLKYHRENGVLITEECTLKGVGVFLNGDDYLYLEVEDENN